MIKQQRNQKRETIIISKPVIFKSGAKPVAKYSALLRKLKEELKIEYNEDICVRLRITSANFINSKNLDLVDYVNPSNNKHLKPGDSVLACRWKLGSICFRNDDGTKTLYHLNGDTSAIIRNNACYIIQTLFKKSADGRSGLRVCFNGYDFYKVLKDLEYIELIPETIINPKSYKIITLKEFNNHIKQEKTAKKIDCNLSEEQIRKLDMIKNNLGYPSLSNVIRKLISDYKI